MPVVSRQTTAELLRVLTYPKFRLTAADRTELLEDYLPYAEIVVMSAEMPALPIQCRDRDDVMFLALAIIAQTPLVSGDADLSILKASSPIEVLSATELRTRIPA